MSFDARSLERLQQLGRTLPQPLPRPDAARPSPAQPPADGGGRRHRVETETDPQALFRELMQVSPDGSVPPHLMDRLRQAEAEQLLRRREQQRQANGTAGAVAGSNPAAASSRGAAAAPSSPAALRRQAPRPGEPPRALDAETQELYVAFQHLLLEDDGED